MNIREQLSGDIKTAMKEKNQVRLDCLRFLQAAIKKQEIDSRPKELTEDDVMLVVRKLVKQRQESIAQFQAANRSDLADKENVELKILETYLPAQMSRPEVEAIVDAVIKKLGATSQKQMGLVMKDVQAQLAGRADNKTVSEVVKSRLTS